jgi:CRP/FNR family transcriptional regulator, dissimilatory nitrate respiration regulator
LLDVLGKSFLFKNLKADQIELIAALIDEEESYPKDAVVFQQGERDTSLYLIKEGSVRLSKVAPDGNQSRSNGECERLMVTLLMLRFWGGG